jgi:hypothetical protein
MTSAMMISMTANHSFAADSRRAGRIYVSRELPVHYKKTQNVDELMLWVKTPDTDCLFKRIIQLIDSCVHGVVTVKLPEFYSRSCTDKTSRRKTFTH